MNKKLIDDLTNATGHDPFLDVDIGKRIGVVHPDAYYTGKEDEEGRICISSPQWEDCRTIFDLPKREIERGVVHGSIDSYTKDLDLAMKMVPKSLYLSINRYANTTECTINDGTDIVKFCSAVPACAVFASLFYWNEMGTKNGKTG